MAAADARMSFEMAQGTAPPVSQFVGCRRRLPPDDALFEAGNMQREELAKQAARDAVKDERAHLAREHVLAQIPVLDELAQSYECSTCRALLPTAHLLDLHIMELHDSFWAARAARRMPVYACSVEGCGRHFCTVEERKQHLVDHHRFPRELNYDRIHLRRRKAQVRPLPQYQKAAARQGMETDERAESPSSPAPGAAEPGSVARLAAADADAVAGALTRLSVAAEHSRVPNVVSFGRGRGMGLPAVARGRGGQRLHAGAAE